MSSFNSYSQPHQQQQHLQPQPQPQPQPQQHHHLHHHHHHHHQFFPNPKDAAPLMGPTTATATVAASTSATSTLLVRHLPEAIPHDMLSRLFSHYGASAVRPCAGGKLRNCAFVDFTDEALASQAQAQMNRLRFLGKVLSVERVGGNTNPSNRDVDSQSEPQPKDTAAPPPLLLNDSSKQNNLIYGAEPIAPRLGLDYPFPPYLEYAYPPPDGNILTNIVNSLIAVPRFYTQVLHLMNKMNLQPPFRMALPTPPLPAPVPPLPPPPPVTVEPLQADLSSEESELESSEDDAGNNHSRKRVKREAIVGPAIDKDVAHEAVGLKPVSLVPKEVPVIKKKNPVLQIKIAPRPTQKLNTNDMSELTGPVKEQVEQKPYATPEDIEKMKLPPEDILSLPKFKNYTSGNPAKVLYIKNLAKDVVIDDFYFIFGSLFESVEAAKSTLSIKLMKEGRMRGQAFVTFPSIDLAQRALNLVNGYEFKGKPMIIHFGHNPSAGKTT